MPPVFPDRRTGRALRALEWSTSDAPCFPQWGAGKRTVLFVADPGTFSNTPENAIYVKNLKGSTKLPPGVSGCPDVLIGTIMGQPVSIITTGIGSEAAALCVYEILLRCGPLISEATYSGTSGWSPQLGGILNNGTCEGGKANTNGKITRLGDVCISPFAVNWNCRKASWTMTSKAFPNVCTFPEQLFSAQSDFLFGQCSYYGPAIQASVPFALEVTVAAQKGLKTLPPRPKALQDLETKYWAAMAEGTGLTYPALAANATPYLWNYKQCMEISSQFFWSGAPWDMVARSYIASTLNAANMTVGKPLRPYTQSDVLVVSAMEAIGIAAAIERYATLKPAMRAIPFTVVRGMSNHAVSAVAKGNTTGVWLPGDEVPEDFENGYKYAIQSGSTAVLSFLKERCLKKGGATACKFTL